LVLGEKAQPDSCALSIFEKIKGCAWWSQKYDSWYLWNICQVMYQYRSGICWIPAV